MKKFKADGKEYEADKIQRNKNGGFDAFVNGEKIFEVGGINDWSAFGLDKDTDFEEEDDKYVALEKRVKFLENAVLMLMKKGNKKK